MEYKDFIINAEFKLTIPTESFVEGMDKAKDTTTEMLIAMSREYGLPIKLVSVDPMPKVEGIKMEGKL